MNNIVIRQSTEQDLEDIARIYAKEVLHGLASFETQPPSPAELGERRQVMVGSGLPYLVATLDSKVVGYAYAGPYRARAAYRFSVENSVYVDAQVRRSGIGKRLLEQLIHECEKGPWRQMIAVIGDSNNKGSIAVHAKVGFHPVGTINAVGYKHNQWVDTVIMQRALGDGEKTKP